MQTYTIVIQQHYIKTGMKRKSMAYKDFFHVNFKSKANQKLTTRSSKLVTNINRLHKFTITQTKKNVKITNVRLYLIVYGKRARKKKARLVLSLNKYFLFIDVNP
jgi:hypothetical protein